MPLTPQPIHTAEPTELAAFAAQGVALALNARLAKHIGPVHIICGIPQELFTVALEPNAHGQLNVGTPVAQRGQ